MPIDHTSNLAHVQRFDQLVEYLRDVLDWPISMDDFEDQIFDYMPEELGIDPRNAVKISEIKRLRSIDAKQPWGIFFVKFEPKYLPVTALRRILRQVTLKKRPSTNDSEHQSWDTNDLLFISNYGEGDRRSIAFAHFSDPRGRQNLPTLKILGWDDLDTPLHLKDVSDVLLNHLRWPDDTDDIDAWRKIWREAFTLEYGEVITTSKQLASRLANLARSIRTRIEGILAIETETGPFTQLLKTFQTAFFNDLDPVGFADMYAQTIAYGLLSARITDPKKRTVDDFAAHMRTNPFLKELLITFMRFGERSSNGRGVKLDFDELGVSDIVDLLDRSNMEAVVRDFGDRNPRDDPVIHFYEHFLAAYDKKQKIERGVFYTPKPIVSYIVRSVDEILRTKFGLVDGFADITTWGEMAERHKDLTIPTGISPDQAFIQILDPAVGTGTFLVEIIDQIHQRMREKWTAQLHTKENIDTLWNDYVSRHLLPRLHGYELMMAPYTIAHLKIGLKLFETGYRFEHDARAQVYLTNAEEPPSDTRQYGLDFMPSVAHEAEAVNNVKRTQRFTVIIGNPPYLGEAGRGGEWIASLMRGCELPGKRKTASYFEVNGKPIGEKNPKLLNDFYVRFTRLSQYLIEQTGTGVHSFITNHGYIDNPTFRGMRWALLTTFDDVSVLDLHGNLNKKEVAPGGGPDKNVFDIQQGVAIGLFVKNVASRTREELPKLDVKVFHCDVWGERETKYDRLLKARASDTKWITVEPCLPWFFLRELKDFRSEYDNWISVKDIFLINSVGITTARDALTIQWSQKEIWDVVCDMCAGDVEDLRVRYCLGKDVRDWKVVLAKQDLRNSGPVKGKIKEIWYRPFDTRYTYYTGKSRGFLSMPRPAVMGHMLRENVALISCRQQKRLEDEWSQVFTSSKIIECTAISNKTSEISSVFPLYHYPHSSRIRDANLTPWPEGKEGRWPNLDPNFVQNIENITDLGFVSEGRGDCALMFGPEDVLAYIYAVFHSSEYRSRYESQLKIDFARVPYPRDTGSFCELVTAGHKLLALHLLDSPHLDYPPPNGIFWSQKSTCRVRGLVG